MRRLILPLAAALVFIAFGASAATAPATAAIPAASVAKPTSSVAATAKPAPMKATAVTRCRDDKGKFVACAKKPAAERCRDSKGKFIACAKKS